MITFVSKYKRIKRASTVRFKCVENENPEDFRTKPEKSHHNHWTRTAQVYLKEE